MAQLTHALSEEGLLKERHRSFPCTLMLYTLLLNSTMGM
jgi:hypothetical protein